MHRLAPRSFALSGIVMVAGLVAAGCGLFGPSTQTGPSVARHRGSPDSLFRYFASASSSAHHSATGVASCLDSTFSFYFSAADRGAHPDSFPEAWPRAVYTARTAQMSATATSISLSLAILDTLPTPGDFTLSVTLEVTVPDTAGATRYQVHGTAGAHVARDRADSTQWTITSMSDHTDSSGVATWGGVLSLFGASAATRTRDTPGHLLDFFASEMSDSIRDPAQVAACLDTAFGFSFTQLDATTIGAPSWDRDRFMSSVGRMLQAANRVSLHLGVEDTLNSGPCVTGHPKIPVCGTYRTRVTLDVTANDSLVYEVRGLADFETGLDPADTTALLIRKVEDHTDQPDRALPRGPTPPLFVPTTTWGHVLAQW